MGRSPCCEKMGQRKGPWATEEDEILMNYINKNGHGNWRALPKLAGLLRCGKSCRLRWMNYLRPDIKRGNFSREEEDTIIKLHEQLGNRWSVIAARLPGRTDNEIKNVWHTHLKKRLNKKQIIQESSKKSEPSSPVSSTSEISSSSTITITAVCDGGFLDESFWSVVFSGDDSSVTSEISAANSESQVQIPLDLMENSYGFESNLEDGMGFWYDLFARAGERVELPEF